MRYDQLKITKIVRSVDDLLWPDQPPDLAELLVRNILYDIPDGWGKVNGEWVNLKKARF